MTTRVGIRELKAKLSHYLDRAAAGETIVVTDRGNAKAELRPLSVDARLEQGIRDGWIRPGVPGSGTIPAAGAPGRTTIAAALAEDRGE